MSRFFADLAYFSVFLLAAVAITEFRAEYPGWVLNPDDFVYLLIACLFVVAAFVPLFKRLLSR